MEFIIIIYHAWKQVITSIWRWYTHFWILHEVTIIVQVDLKQFESCGLFRFCMVRVQDFSVSTTSLRILFPSREALFVAVLRPFVSTNFHVQIFLDSSHLSDTLYLALFVFQFVFVQTSFMVVFYGIYAIKKRRWEFCITLKFIRIRSKIGPKHKSIHIIVYLIRIPLMWNKLWNNFLSLAYPIVSPIADFSACNSSI